MQFKRTYKDLLRRLKVNAEYKYNRQTNKANKNTLEKKKQQKRSLHTYNPSNNRKNNDKQDLPYKNIFYKIF